MFTGIISDFGEVLDVDERAEGLRRITVALRLRSGFDRDRRLNRLFGSLPHRCRPRPRRQPLLLLGRYGSRDAAHDHRRRLAARTKLDLERALRLGDELGGHMVSGHVDGLAEVVSRDDFVDSVALSFRAPAALPASSRPRARSRSTAFRSPSMRSTAILSRFSSFRTPCR